MFESVQLNICGSPHNNKCGNIPKSTSAEAPIISRYGSLNQWMQQAEGVVPLMLAQAPCQHLRYIPFDAFGSLLLTLTEPFFWCLRKPSSFVPLFLSEFYA